jgi:FKBP-type peptidyl-prolyl cis-trans isomerase
MEKFKNYLVWFTLFSGSLPALRALTVPESAAGADPKSVADAPLVAFSKEQQKAYIEAYGHWLVVSTGVVNFGFNKEESAVFLGGIGRALAGEELPPNSEKGFDENMQLFFLQKEQAKIEDTKKLGEVFLKTKSSEPGYRRTDSGLVVKVEAPGNARRADDSSAIVVDYEGKCNGEIFDSTFERGEKATLRLPEVIPGIAEGIQLVGEGGKVTLFIPSDLAYGDESFGPISGGSVLEFTITVHSIAKEVSAAASPALESSKN